MAYIYNLHNILTIKSDIELSLPNSITPTFDYFKIEEDLNKYDLVIKYIRCKDIDTKKYQELAHGLYYSEEEDSVLSYLNILSMEIYWEIRNLFKENAELKVSKSYKWFSKYVLKVPISSVYPLTLLIRNILQLKFLLKNATFLVGSAVVINKQGIILTGMGGSGKTSLILNFMNYPNLKFLSDDLLIVSNNTIYGFPSLILVRRYNIGSISVRKYIKPFDTYRERFVQSYKGNFHIYFLEKSTTKKYIKQISYEEGINKLCAFNNKTHCYFNERILSYLPYLYRDFSLLNMQKKQQEILLELFKNAVFYIIYAEYIGEYIEILKKKYITN